MSTDTKTHPAATFRLGSIKCTIWPNTGTNDRTYYAAQIVKSYRLPAEKRDQSDDGWRETSSMQAEDLIVLQELARRATEWIRARTDVDTEHTDEAAANF